MTINQIILINCEWLSAISDAANIIIAIGVGITAFTYFSARKGNYLQTIENCSREYRDYMRQIQLKVHELTLEKDMLGLFHKQLFYIKNNYVPKEIKIEWIMTMHSVLIEKKYSDEKLLFCKNDCDDQFSRVRDFMELSKKKSSEEKPPTPNLVGKRYKKYYFTRKERMCLNRNKQWEKAFN